MVVILIIIILVVAGFALPRLGKALLVLLGVLVLGALGIAAWVYQNNLEQNREREAAKTRIRIAEVDLSDLTLGSGSSSTLAGRVKNNSKTYRLSEIVLKITMRDCDAAGKCEIVGEEEVRSYSDIPPGQARDISQYVSFSGLGSPRGKRQWDYSVVEISGKP